MENDLIMSSVIGLGIGGILLLVLQRFPGQPYRYDIAQEEDNKEAESERKDEIVGTTKSKRNQKEYSVNEIIQEVSEESMIKKTTKLRKALGIDEEVIRKAVRQTKEEAKTGITTGDETNYLKLMDWMVFLIVIFAGLYFLNFASNGQVYRVFHGLFPAEFETLKLPRPT